MHFEISLGFSDRGLTSGLDALDSTIHVSLQINSGTHQHQTVTDSPYAKPNKATKSSQSPLPVGEGTQTRVHITETHTTHLYQPGESQPLKQNQLDSMLGNLQADMSRQGVNTTQKGCCNACEKPIVGQVAVSYNRQLHRSWILKAVPGNWIILSFSLTL